MTQIYKENVILYRCHFMNDEIMEQYKKIKEDCGHKYDVVFLSDSIKDEIIFQGLQHHVALPKDIQEMGYRIWDGKGLYFHMDYPVLHFYRTFPSYKHYWVLEYDVGFAGNWADFFRPFEDNDADLLSTFIRTYREDPKWIWWHQHNLPIPDNELKAIFCPVVRFSNRALAVLHEKHLDGLGGYCEVVIPTLLEKAGLKVQDITERFYDPLVSFNYNGVISRVKGKLLHPVKKVGLFKRMVAIYRFLFRAKYDSHWSIRIGRVIVYKIFRIPENSF